MIEMPHSRRGKALAAIGLAAAVMSGALSCSHRKPSGYWPMNVGNRWTFAGKMEDKEFGQTYSVSDVRAEGSTQDIFVTDTVNDKLVDTERYQKTAEGLFRAGSDLHPSSGTETPFLLIPTAVKAGQSWNWTGTVTRKGKAGKAIQRLTAVGMEAVETPSGKYQAMHIHSDLAVTIEGHKYSFPNDYWFAEGIGPVKLSAEVPDTGVLEETLASYNLN